ncbi:MAG: TolC family protein [Elusimicrobia bacterium]|nr:TolC family protein [Elusimicrobiota bacterium]
MNASVAGEQKETIPFYDLPSCIKTAFSQNPSLILAQKEIGITNARRHVSASALLTAISLKMEETTGRAEVGARTPSFVTRQYGVQATQPIFSGGKLWADWRRSSRGSEIARLQMEKQRLDVRHSITETFWRVVALEKALAIYKVMYKDLQEDLAKAVRHELGEARSAKIELLSARAQNRECEQLIAETEENLLETRLNLLEAMGHSRYFLFEVPLEIPSSRVEVNEAECLRLARSHRLEIKIAEKVMESAALGRRVARSAYFPRVDLNGFLGRSGSAYVETDPFTYRKDWNAGVKASWPLFWSTLKYSALKEKTSPKLGESSRTETESQTLTMSLGDALGMRVENLENKKSFQEEQWRFEKARRDVEQEVRLAVLRVEAAKKKLESANAKTEEAQQMLKDTRSLLQEDRAHLGDLASARTRVSTAQAAQAQAQADYIIAVSALNNAIGIADHHRVE